MTKILQNMYYLHDDIGSNINIFCSYIDQHSTLIGNKKQNISYSWIIKNIPIIPIMTHLIKDNRVLKTKINCHVVKHQMGKTCTTRYLGG